MMKYNFVYQNNTGSTLLLFVYSLVKSSEIEFKISITSLVPQKDRLIKFQQFSYRRIKLFFSVILIRIIHLKVKGFIQIAIDNSKTPVLTINSDT